MIAIALLGGLIAVSGLIAWLTTGAPSTILQQTYNVLLIISGILGLLTVAVAAGVRAVRNAIRAATKAAADDRRQLFLMLRDATFTVKSAAGAMGPQAEWVEVERGESAGEGGEGRSTPLVADVSTNNSEIQYRELRNSDRNTISIFVRVSIFIFVVIIMIALFI